MTMHERILAFGTGAGLMLALLLFLLAQPAPTVSRSAQLAAVPNALQSPDIRAESAIVYDPTTRTILYAKNEHAQLPLASLIKVPLVVIVRSVLNANDPVLITKGALAQEGDSGLVGGEVWNTRTLSDFTLVSSSNDGAAALANAARPLLRTRYNTPLDSDPVIWRMNTFFSELGLHETYAVNETGLDVNPTLSGAYGSAFDMARLFAHITMVNPDILEATVKDGVLVYSENGNGYVAANTNDALGEIPGLIGGKTGFTDLAGGNLVTVFDAGLSRPIVVVVLGSTREGRFSDTRTLVDATRAYLSERED